jgi:hypothetical protein
VTIFLSLTAFLALAYPTFALINQLLPLTTPLYPPWQWALAFTWPALGNRLVLKRPRSLLWLFFFNLFILLPAASMFLPASYPSGPWPAVLPAIMELALVWIPLASFATQQMGEEDLRRLWESGLIVAAVVALTRELSRTYIPLFHPSLLIYLAVGVALRALAARDAASLPDASGRCSVRPLAAGLAVLFFGAVLGLLFAGRRVAAWLLAALQEGWDFLCLLFYYLVLLLDWLDLNIVATQSVDRTKMPGASLPMEQFHEPQIGPLWLMIPLWIILAVLIIFLIWMLFKLLLENIALWRRETAGRIPPARRRLRRLDLRFLPAAVLSLARFLAGRLVRCYRRRYPRDLPLLYEAFILWGKRNRLPRHRWETPGNYLLRLEPEVVLNRRDLLPSLRNLTLRYERFCYGQNGNAGLMEEELTLARRLRCTRLHRRKLPGFISPKRGEVKPGHLTHSGSSAGRSQMRPL